MAKFLLVNRFGEGQGPAEGTEAHSEEMREWGAFNRSIESSGSLVWSLALDEPECAVAHTVDAGGSPVRTTGRRAAAEGVFALYLVEEEDRAAAEEWAKRMPTAAYGTVEVRTIMHEVDG